MATLKQSLTQPRDALHKALPRLYKFAIVLTANEQLARALIRAAYRLLAARKDWRGKDRDYLLDAQNRVYELWIKRTASDPQLQHKNPPEPRLFAASLAKSALPQNGQFAKFMAGLPSAQRAALYLVYGEGASYDEAAEVISVNMLSLMNLLARGHVALAHWLDHRGLSEGAALHDETGSRPRKQGAAGRRPPEQAA
jgi:RNA polymerase sigma-70 factor (ECF subfamily)